MSRQTSTGTCSLCGKTFGRASMARHLKNCAAAGQDAAGEMPPKRRSSGSIHLFVEAGYDKGYWMHLAVPGDAPLGVDAFLRQTWLECCGHLSGFTIAGECYASETRGASGMQVRLNRVLQPGMTFSYEYDYGSTSELILKVVGVWDRASKRGPVELLARNDPPQVLCQICGSGPATQICAECIKGWLCGRCADNHKCGTEMCLPVVNSPRAGVCGYTG